MTRLFESPPAGRLILPRLPDLDRRLTTLERRVARLEGLVEDDS
jgi:hypothetical protein